jgi:hypothetical protein
MTKPKARNPMDSGDLLLHRHHDRAPEEGTARDPDVGHLNGRETTDHERGLVLEARRAERAEAADGILGGLIKKPKL